MRILIVFLVLLYSNLSLASAKTDETAELRTYVEKLIQQGYDLVNDQKLTKEQQKQKSSELIKTHMHLDWMAQYTLGRHKRQLSKEQLNQFIKVYSNFVVKAYTDLTMNYKGEKAVLTNVKQIDDDLFIVNTEFIRPGTQSPIKVDYLIHEVNSKEDRFLVGDIITEGVSILNSQQAEFDNTISTYGIEKLIADLKKKAATGTPIK